MNAGYTISALAKPDDAVWEVVGWGIQHFNEQQAGDTQHRSLCFVLRAPDQSVAGGLIGSTYWNWMYIDLLFVKEGLRGIGYGHRLLEMAEEEARQRGAKHAYLDSFSFQAPDFYARHGYQVFGELADFPAGHKRFFFTKRL